MTAQPLSATHLKKYRQAGWAFFVFNLLYVGMVYVFLPPFNLGVAEAAGYTALALVLFGALSYFIYKGGKVLTVILIGLYGTRVVFSFYTLTTGEAFEAVPYVLPTTIAAFYMLCRAFWNWR
ncbi:hypothetical protein [Nitrospina watsonii]|uniref:Transmembrane protein n=1 Tax=Nitrospina watsonii TaxID=1323948 RepID=A0ABN8VX61_9BACT|nr:hypothetical protein [Nitrospina watsonii]CAI2717419.1 conserved membrane protein of unknown function [Nitrospina watsonii]